LHGGGGWSAYAFLLLVRWMAYCFFGSTRKSNVPIVGGFAKSVTEKNNSRVEYCGEAFKRLRKLRNDSEERGF